VLGEELEVIIRYFLDNEDVKAGVKFWWNEAADIY
jgi:hypothetical protein